MDTGQEFDNVYLGGVVVQFIPWQDWIPDGSLTTFLTTISGSSDISGHLRGVDGSIGVSLPVRDPAEGLTAYRVRVIPPDGSTLRPYEFNLGVAPGDTPLDISSTTGVFPMNPGVVELWVGDITPPNEAEGVWWMDVTDPYRYELRKWVA